MIPLLISHKYKPYLTYENPNHDSSSEITINLELDLPDYCTLFYYPESQKTQIQNMTNPNSLKLHKFHLSHLRDSTKYLYNIVCGPNLAFTNEFPYSFTTQNLSKPLHFTIVGDTQINPTGISHMPFILSAMRKYSPEFSPFLHLGDVAQYMESKILWNLFFGYSSSLLKNKTLFAVPGNHDVQESKYNSSNLLFLKYLGDMDNKLLVYPNAIIIGMIDFDDLPNKYWKFQLEWLNNTLFKYQDKPIKIIMGHRPHLDIHLNEPRIAPISDLFKLFEQYKITMILNGHIHAYQRFHIENTQNQHKILNIIVGGGGGTLEPLMHWENYEYGNYRVILQEQNPAPCFSTLDIYENNTVIFKTLSIYSQIIDYLKLSVNSENYQLSYENSQIEKSYKICITPGAITAGIAVVFLLILLCCAVFEILYPNENVGLFLYIGAKLSELEFPKFIMNTTYSPINNIENFSYDPGSPKSSQFHYETQKPKIVGVCRMILSAISAYFTVFLAFSCGSGYSILISGAYNYRNNFHYDTTIIINIFGAGYAIYITNLISTKNIYRWIYDAVVFLIYFGGQIFANTTFGFFDDWSVGIGLLLGIILIAILIEQITICQKISTQYNYSAISPTSKQVFVSHIQKPGSKITEFLVSPAIFSAISLIVLLEFITTWAGLSIGTIAVYIFSLF